MSSDKLERLLSGRDRAGRPLLGDQLQQLADLRPRREPELVAVDERLCRIARLRFAQRVGQVEAIVEGERLERPRLRLAAEAVERAGRSVGGRRAAQERDGEAPQL